jgi:hypothetical protein
MGSLRIYIYPECQRVEIFSFSGLEESLGRIFQAIGVNFAKGFRIFYLSEGIGGTVLAFSYFNCRYFSY